MTTFIQYAVLGLGVGAIYALLVQGMIVIYAGSGVLNLAQGAVAMFGAYCFRQFRYVDHWNFWPAFLLSILICAGIGIAMYQLVMRPLPARVVACEGGRDAGAPARAPGCRCSDLGGEHALHAAVASAGPCTGGTASTSRSAGS